MSAKNWIAPESIRIPDFIICGTMESGTSTLHYILSQHPHIYIPSNEIHFFDIDNVFQHPDFCHFYDSNWFVQRFQDNPMSFWRWYASQFDGANENQIIGEDSTTYIASEIAAKRIKLQRKRIKLIVILRQPTSRAYSQYWHMVRTGRAMYSFEDTIRFDPYSILYRSLYYAQLQSLFRNISQEDVKIIIFEEFLTNKHEVIREVCDHISVDYELLPKDSIDSHKNKGLIPRYPKIQVWKNRFLREEGNLNYYSKLPVKPDAPIAKSKTKEVMLKLINRLHNKLNPLSGGKPPIIKSSTKKFLDELFKKELKGINELLRKDVTSMWFDVQKTDLT
jgi:hypothetical protein